MNLSQIYTITYMAITDFITKPHIEICIYPFPNSEITFTGILSLDMFPFDTLVT